MRDNNSIQEHIDNIIWDAFASVDNAYQHPENSRIIFPLYRDERGGGLRVSEQELRFAFVESFVEYVNSRKLGWHYAVEVPTKGKYYFVGSEPNICDTGRSAMVDLVIYSEDLCPICLIEFKSNNPRLKAYKKDFVKLMNSEEGNSEILRYFIQIVKSSDDKTVENIKEKYDGARNYVAQNFSIECLRNVKTKTHSLEHKGKNEFNCDQL